MHVLMPTDTISHTYNITTILLIQQELVPNKTFHALLSVAPRHLHWYSITPDCERGGIYGPRVLIVISWNLYTATLCYCLCILFIIFIMLMLNMLRFCDNSNIRGWQTGYGKLQTMLKTIQTLYTYRNMTATLTSIKTRLETVGIFFFVKQLYDGNFARLL